VENVLSSKFLTTRRGTIAVGIGAAVLAGIVLLVYLNQYRKNVNSEARPISVLVAKSLIQKGTPGDIVGTQNLFQVSSIPKSDLKTGALVDPASLKGRVAAVDVYPGQQITASDFTVGGVAPLLGDIARGQRAISIPLGGPNSLSGQLIGGDHVDVYVGVNAQVSGGPAKAIIKLVLQDMYVLAVNGGSVTFRTTPVQAAQLAYASENGTIWLVLRPTTGAPPVRPPVVDANALLGKGSVYGG
jgi:Flp pilus assembly protein CpaB